MSLLCPVKESHSFTMYNEASSTCPGWYTMDLDNSVCSVHWHTKRVIGKLLHGKLIVQPKNLITASQTLLTGSITSMGLCENTTALPLPLLF